MEVPDCVGCFDGGYGVHQVFAIGARCEPAGVLYTGQLIFLNVVEVARIFVVGQPTGLIAGLIERVIRVFMERGRNRPLHSIS